MFNKDFYPTPKQAIELMLEGIELSGKTVLEPSAGSGKIVDHCQLFGANVLACEINNDLAKIVSQKCQFLKPDFLEVQPEEISHIHFIIMNPPFSADEKHIIHAWEIAPEGCEIISLCNFEILSNDYTKNRKKLTELIKNNGTSKKLGSIFVDAERKTKAIIGLVKLSKPKKVNDEFDGYFDLTEEADQQQNGLMQYSEVQNIVSRYVGAIKMWDSVQQSAIEINSLISPINSNLGIGFGAHWTDSNKNRFSQLDREIFKKELQKSAWRSIFGKFNMNKYVTSGVMADINKFVEQQQAVPFTVKNIYKMLEMIVGTHAGRMDKVLVEAFDHICSLSSENSEAGEKWKTNSNYKVNRRFIISRITKIGWSGELDIEYSGDNKINDIVKALCFMTGTSYDDQFELGSWFNYPYKIECDGKILSGYQNHSRRLDEWSFNNRIEGLKKTHKDVKVIKVEQTFGKWHEWGFFRVRGYKKGTMHFEFIDEKVWMEFNRRVSKIKGWQIPQKTDSKQKGTERRKSKKVDIY